jgi:hypothetical protein
MKYILNPVIIVARNSDKFLNVSTRDSAPGTSTITLKPLKVKHFQGLVFYGDRFGDHLKIREYFPIFLLIIFRIQFTVEAQMI